MEYYPIVGEWDRQRPTSRWAEWSSGDGVDEVTGWFRVSMGRVSMYASGKNGKPGQRFASGPLAKGVALTGLPVADGFWGTLPDADPSVDLWAGEGIRKLATLEVTNLGLYRDLFGLA